MKQTQVQVLGEELGEKTLIRKQVVYVLTDKGERLLEICKDLSDGEAGEFLGISPRQLGVLRTIWREGPKRGQGFPYYARYALKRMVEKGFLVKTVEGIDAEELKRLRDKGLKNREIAEKLGISKMAVQYWVNRLNLKKRQPPPSMWMRRANQLRQLLKRNGPIPKREAVKALGFNNTQIESILKMFPEEFQKLKFTASGKKYRRNYHSLSEASPVLTLKGDPRIVDFAASKINMKVQTPHEARSVFQLLKWQLGPRQARLVVEKLGYRYKGKLQPEGTM